jgi:hypothetical protein
MVMGDNRNLGDSTVQDAKDTPPKTSDAVQQQALDGKEDLSKSTVDYYNQRRAGMRDRDTQEILGKQPEFYDSALQTLDSTSRGWVSNDDQGRATEIEYPGGKKTGIEYGADGQPSKIADRDGTSITKQDDGSWERKDAQGNTVDKYSEVAVVGGDIHMHRADGTGQIQHHDGSNTLEKADKSSITTDRDGQVTDVYYGDGSKVKVRNESGDQVEITDRDGGTYKKHEDGTWSKYDAKGVPVDHVNDVRVSPNGDMSVVRNDNTGTTRHTDGSRTEDNGNGSRFDYDSQGRITDVGYPGGKHERIKYGDDGKPAEIAEREGTKLKREEDGTWSRYDKDGKIVARPQEVRVNSSGEIEISNANESSEIRHTDGTKTITEKSGAEIRRNENDQVTDVKTPGGGTKHIDYDANGEPKRITEESGYYEERQPDGTWKLHQRSGRAVDRGDSDWLYMRVDKNGDIVRGGGDIVIVNRPDGSEMRHNSKTGQTTDTRK